MVSYRTAAKSLILGTKTFESCQLTDSYDEHLFQAYKTY